MTIAVEQGHIRGTQLAPQLPRPASGSDVESQGSVPIDPALLHQSLELPELLSEGCRVAGGSRSDPPSDSSVVHAANPRSVTGASGHGGVATRSVDGTHPGPTHRHRSSKTAAADNPVAGGSRLDPPLNSSAVHVANPRAVTGASDHSQTTSILSPHPHEAHRPHPHQPTALCPRQKEAEDRRGRGRR